MNSYKLLIARYSSFTEKSRRFNDTFLQQTDDLSKHFLTYLFNSFFKLAKSKNWEMIFFVHLSTWIVILKVYLWHETDWTQDDRYQNKLFFKLKRVRFVARDFYSHKTSCPKTVYLQWMMVKRTCDILSKQYFHPFYSFYYHPIIW